MTTPLEVLEEVAHDGGHLVRREVPPQAALHELPHQTLDRRRPPSALRELAAGIVAYVVVTAVTTM
jgi:hypothetical protein